jgi:hypothetical protein
VRACLDGLVTALYVTIDDLLDQRTGPGRPPRLSDAELVTLAVAQVLLGCPTEHRWLRSCYGRLGHLFPYLPNQPGSNKRLRQAAPQLALVIRDLDVHTPTWREPIRLLDSTPLPCGTSRGTVRRSDVAELGARLVRPDRADEPRRLGRLGGIRQWVERIIDTFKGQLSLEQHGARTVAGVFVRVAQRLLALAAVPWFNWRIGQPGRHLTPYDH